jgi:hypothetical protein
VEWEGVEGFEEDWRFEEGLDEKKTETELPGVGVGE